MEPQDAQNIQKKVVDRLHEIQKKAESGKFTDALAAIKEVKAADTKNIYLIAIEKQIAKLCDTSVPEEIRTGIVKSLPSMLDRAIDDIQRRAPAAKVDESQKEQKEAALEKLKSQYFQRADDYVEKHEYQRALEEIRRIYIIEPGSVVAKEYEQKIEQLAAIHARNVAEKEAAEEKEAKKAAAKEKEIETKAAKVETEKPKAAAAESEPSKRGYELIEEKEKSKLPILIAAAAVVIAAGAWFLFFRSSSDELQTSQEQAQLPITQDSIDIPTPAADTPAAQPKTSVSVAETAKPPARSESRTSEEKPAAQTQRPAQTTPAPQTAQPASTRPQQTQTTPPAAQTQQPAVQQPAAQQPAAQQPSTTSSTPAPMPFVAMENPPEVLKRVAPSYPEVAVKMGIQGRVVVEVTVDPQGKPIQTKVVKSSSEVLNDAAIEAIMKYTFKPAMQSNNPITAKIHIPIDFRLK
ncbi:MAG: TonB family protein [Bacteroidetes bacterium]|nr:TonB family protein [Bacteroidota bacterium]